MNLKLESKSEIQENLSTTTTIPCSEVMKKNLDALKRSHGAKAVNEKLREMIQDLIVQNKDKIEKAG